MQIHSHSCNQQINQGGHAKNLEECIMNKTVKEIIAEIKEKTDARGGLKHVYFVACGG